MAHAIPEECKKSCIMIIDDISFYVSMIEQILKNAGFQGKFLHANNLKKAVEIIQKSIEENLTIDLLITDLHLPDGQATILVKKIRQTKLLENMAVVLVTTNNEAAKVVEAFEAGVDNYIFKPIDEKVLLEKIVQVWTKRHAKA